MKEICGHCGSRLGLKLTARGFVWDCSNDAVCHGSRPLTEEEFHRLEVVLANFPAWGYVDLPAISRRLRQPIACPRCGSPRIVRLLWSNQVPHAEDKAIEAGQALLVGDQVPREAPEWACLECQPEWRTVHQLVLQESTLFERVLEAIEVENFDAALVTRPEREVLASRQWELVSELCRSCAVPGLLDKRADQTPARRGPTLHPSP